MRRGQIGMSTYLVTNNDGTPFIVKLTTPTTESAIKALRITAHAENQKDRLSFVRLVKGQNLVLRCMDE